MNVYTEDFQPEHIKYILNNEENIIVLTKIFGETNFSLLNTSSYTSIDLEKNDWYPSPDFIWLYRNQPTLSSINDIQKYLRFKKIKNIKKIIYENAKTN